MKVEHFVCDRCGADSREDKRGVAHWAQMILVWVGIGSEGDCLVAGQKFQFDLCPACRAEVQKFSAPQRLSPPVYPMP